MEKLLIALGAFTFVCIIAILLALPIMWLWNWLMPSIFGLIKIGIFKAFGMNLLCGILFKSHGSIK